LVIELINIEKNQQVEVLIDTNGTIYKVKSWLQQMVKIS
jgi:TusA-related sulfurtransferase